MIIVDLKVVTSAECKAQLTMEEAAHWIQKTVSLDQQSCLPSTCTHSTSPCGSIFFTLTGLIGHFLMHLMLDGN